MKDISIIDYLSIIKKRSWLVIILTIIPVIVSGFMNFYSIKTEPEYKAYSAIIIGGPKEYLRTDEQLDYDTYKAINGKLTSHFNELLKMKVVANEVINNLDLNMSYREFSEKMNIELIDKTEIIRIEVKDSNPELAAKIVEEIIFVSSKKAEKLIGVKNVQAIDETQVIPVHHKSKATANMAVSGILGFIISIIIIFVIEYLDTSIKTPSDVETYLGLPVTGIIPKSENDLIVDNECNSLLTESYRSLIMNILNIQTNKELKSILITSSDYNDKSDAVALNIALAMSQVQNKTLFIDGNMRKSKIYDFLNLDNNSGLSDILSEKVECGKVINEITEDFHIITPGKTKSNPVELLSSPKMVTILNKLRDQYDIIVINSPSLGVLSDATIISTLTEGTFLVCTSGKSDIKEVRIGKKLLEKANANILGVILNEVNVKEGSFYRYYYKGYKYYNQKS